MPRLSAIRYHAIAGATADSSPPFVKALRTSRSRAARPGSTCEGGRGCGASKVRGRPEGASLTCYPNTMAARESAARPSSPVAGPAAQGPC